MQVYYIHFTSLHDRLRTCLPLLLESGISPQIVSQFSAHPYFLSSTYSQLFDTTELKLAIANQVNIIFPHLISNCVQLSPSLSLDSLQLKRSLLESVLNPSKSTIEHSCQHLFCLDDHSDHDQSSFILVLEDDAVPAIPAVLDHLKRVLSENPFNYESPFFIDLGNGLGLTPISHTSDMTYEVHRVENGRTRCSFAYVISYPACRLLLSLARESAFYPYLPSDWYLSVLLTYLEIPTYWIACPLFVQGSETGIANSNKKNRLASSSLLPH